MSFLRIKNNKIPPIADAENSDAMISKNPK